LPAIVGVHHDAAGDEESPSESGIGVVVAIVLLTDRDGGGI